MKRRLIVIAALAVVATSIAVVSSSASGGTANTLDLTGKVTSFHTAYDAKPAGPSAGDVGYVTGLLFKSGKRVGRYQGICTVLPQSSQECSFTLGLPGGQIVLEAGYGPGLNIGSVALEAVVGGTGTYAGARGQARDREVTNTKLAFHLELQ
jgi:hypothetical protein